jgi:hypothetical protein
MIDPELMDLVEEDKEIEMELILTMERDELDSLDVDEYMVED